MPKLFRTHDEGTPRAYKHMTKRFQYNLPPPPLFSSSHYSGLGEGGGGAEQEHKVNGCVSNGCVRAHSKIKRTGSRTVFCFRFQQLLFRRCLCDFAQHSCWNSNWQKVINNWSIFKAQNLVPRDYFKHARAHTHTHKLLYTGKVPTSWSLFFCRWMMALFSLYGLECWDELLISTWSPSPPFPAWISLMVSVDPLSPIPNKSYGFCGSVKVTTCPPSPISLMVSVEV